MRANGYNLGGEQSGHIIMGNYGTTGDGLLAGLRVLNLIKGKKASDVLACFKPYPQVLKNVTADRAVLETAAVKKAIADAEESLGAKGRVLVRASGTEPLIRVMVEAEDESVIDEIVDGIVEAVEGVK